MLTRKHRNWKAAIYQYINVFDVVTKQLVLLGDMGMYNLLNCCVLCLLVFLFSESRLPIPEVSGDYIVQ